jgi:HTH-type transcriptional regulator / antitoxin HigA
MSSNPKPLRRYPPGSVLAEELRSRGWTQAQFAAILGRPVQAVNGVLNGKREMTPETALQIAAALGTSAEMWVDMESKYRLWLAEQKGLSLDGIRERSRKAS